MSVSEEMKMEKVKLADKFKKGFKGDKKLKIIVIIGAVGIALLLKQYIRL